MSAPTDLQRAMGRMEGTQAAMEQRMGRLEKMVSDGFKSLEEKLEAIEKRESERKGAWKVITVIAGGVGAAASVLVTWALGFIGGQGG